MNRQLSVFIDESGDFGAYQEHSPYYLITMVFHNQNNEIKNAVLALDEQIKNAGFEIHALHTGPIIRREERYRNSKIDERKKLLNALMNFNRHIDINYTLFRIDKKNHSNIIDLTAKIAKQIQLFVTKHLAFFQDFEEIVVYYDNGQIELTRILTQR